MNMCSVLHASSFGTAALVGWLPCHFPAQYTRRASIVRSLVAVEEAEEKTLLWQKYG